MGRVLYIDDNGNSGYKNAVHDNGGGAYAQAGNGACHIGYAGNGGGAQGRRDGKRHAEGHGDQPQAEHHDPLAQRNSRKFTDFRHIDSFSFLV